MNTLETHSLVSSRPNDAFKRSMVEFITSVEIEPKKAYTITNICNKFGFQRRRFYDVMNVLEAVGCCQKVSVDSLIWFGKENINNTLTKLAKRSGAYDTDRTLDEIIPNESCISISRLTQLFVLLFIAMRDQQIDIKQSAAFLSRDNGRYKTTLCKLYQIAHILESTGIIQKARNPGEVRIKDRYFVPIPFPKQANAIPSFIQIETLLSRPQEFESSFANKRRMEYFAAPHFQRMPDINPVAFTAIHA